MSSEAESNLGERLLQAVLNLWKDVNVQRKVLDYHGQEIEVLKARTKALESQIHGLKSSKGRATASNARLRASIAESEDKLQKISSLLS